jgi:hypothetical protein
MRSVSDLSEERQTMLQIRAGFVIQGTSFNAWCEKNGVDKKNATRAINRQWDGPKARALVERIRAASKGVDA